MIIAYSLLFTSITIIWLNKRLALFIFSLSILSAFGNNIINYQALLISAVFFILTITDCKNKLKILLKIIISFLIPALLLHKIPGFNNILIYNQIKFSSSSAPYNMYLNFDKALVGFSLLYVSKNLVSSFKEFKILLIQNFKIILFGIICIIFLSQALGFTKLDVKFPSQIYLWSINNLLIVCLTEEMVFRDFIQKNINKVISGKNSAIVTSILFSLAHYPGGVKYVCLVFVASLLYSYLYYKTNKVELSIIAHFLVNLTHFIFFSYPSL